MKLDISSIALRAEALDISTAVAGLTLYRRHKRRKLVCTSPYTAYFLVKFIMLKGECDWFWYLEVGGVLV